MGESIKKEANLRNRLAKYGAVLLLGGLGGATADHLVSSASSEVKPSATAVAEQQVTQDLALKHAEDVLKGGTASVHYKDGRLENIDNPIIASNGAAVERAQGSDAGENSAVTAYLPGVNGVTSVAYFAEGLNADGQSTVQEAQALTQHIVLERTPGLSGTSVDGHSDGQNYFVPVPGATNAKHTMHVGQGTEYPAA